jgi:hypothetical protein
MGLLCLAVTCCMFNHANRTIGSQDTAGDWVAWSVGSQARQSVSYVKLCMFIVPLFPALFANRLLADWTSHSRCSVCLPPLLCTQFSSELLSVTHPAITPRYHPKTHPHVGALICRHTCFAFGVLHSYFCFLRRWMRNTCGDSIQTKKTFVAIAWAKWFCRIKFGLLSDSPSH